MRVLNISHSSRSLAHSCWRKFQFRKMFQHDAREESLAAARGNALHKGFQSYLMHKDEDRAIIEYMLAYPIHLCQDHLAADSLEAGFSTLMDMINCAPLMNFELASVNCADGVIRPAIEVPFEIEIEGFSIEEGGDFRVSYIGYIDAIFYDVVNDEYVVMDIKTTQRKYMRPDLEYTFSEQCIPYGLVLEYMQGRKIDGFQVKYLSCIVDLLQPNSQVHTYEKTAEDIEDWFRGLLVDLTNLRMFNAMEWFPRTGGGTACSSWNRACPYFDICGVREKDVVQKMLFSGDEAAKDEATYSKSGREKFVPWVKFSLPVEV